MSSSRVIAILGFLGFAFFAQVAAHGHMSIPWTRDLSLSKRQDEQNAPVHYPLNSEFVCRNYAASSPNRYTTLVAGGSTTIQWAMEAAHPGDCFAYLTYDGDNVSDTQKKWFKIAEFSQCNLQNVVNMTLNIPSYLPSCDHCILRWEWVALHLQAINIVEFYSQCADVKISGSSNGRLPTPQVQIPGHIPMDANQYRPGFNSLDLHMTGPPIATIGGADYNCVNTYGSSCNVPSPTNNPCTISTQRCMSETTYQACGIGATTTVWGVEQSCQTGLVCRNHSDGVHIMCTYNTTPATPNTPTSTPNANVPTPNDGCTLQNMRCVDETTYQICTNGNNGNYWATGQSCSTGLFCNPNGNYIYCSDTKPSTPSATTGLKPSTTGYKSPATVSTTGRATPAPVQSTTSKPVAATPVPTTPTPVPTTPTPVPTTPTPVPNTSQCVLGDRRCVALGSNTYQICSKLSETTNQWLPQSCQTGLVCSPSTTDNNIYCVRPQ